VPGPLMRDLLRHHGALEDDLAALESGELHAAVSPDPVPVMTHRQVGCCRMLLGPGELVTPARTHGITQIPVEQIASTRSEGSRLNFQRSGTRYWPLAPDSYSQGSVPAALAKLNLAIAPREHEPQPNLRTDSPVTVNDQLVIRTHRLPAADEAYSPTPEGIHQDNTEVSSVTLVGRRGVARGGESRLWSLATPTGNYKEAELAGRQDGLLLNHVLTQPYETLYFNDRKVKHEARAFDGSRPCSRDVIVNFIRKPLADGSDKKFEAGQLVSVCKESMRNLGSG